MLNLKKLLFADLGPERYLQALIFVLLAGFGAFGFIADLIEPSPRQWLHMRVVMPTLFVIGLASAAWLFRKGASSRGERVVFAGVVPFVCLGLMYAGIFLIGK